MKGPWICVFGIFSALAMAQNNPYQETTQIMDTLFDKSHYDRRVRPFIRKKAVNVTVSMTIVNFGQIREKHMDFTVDMFFYQRWNDERLRHSTAFPLYLSGSEKNLVWMPDTFFLNIKTAKTHMVPADNTKVTIWPSGLVRYSTRLTLTSGCEMNLMDYPLDTQHCNLTILSYSYPEKSMDYVWEAGAIKDIISIMNDAMNEFTLLGIDLHREIYQYRPGPWVHLTATFKFKRRVEYALLQVYAPTLLIVALSWLSFWIPKDAAPARIALGITTVLTIVTLMGSLRSEFPKVSYVKAIDLFFIVSFIFVFGAVLEYILLLLKSSLDENKALERQKQMKCIRKMQDFKDTKNGFKFYDNEDSDEEDEKLKQQETEIRFKQGRRSNAAKSGLKSTTKVVRFMFIENDANIIDRLSRIVFPVGYLLFNTVYWLYYSLSTFK